MLMTCINFRQVAAAAACSSSTLSRNLSKVISSSKGNRLVSLRPSNVALAVESMLTMRNEKEVKWGVRVTRSEKKEGRKSWPPRSMHS